MTLGRQLSAHKFGQLPGKDRTKSQVLRPFRPLAQVCNIISEQFFYLCPGVIVSGVGDGETQDEQIAFRPADATFKLNLSRLRTRKRVIQQVGNYLTQPVRITYKVIRYSIIN